MVAKALLSGNNLPLYIHIDQHTKMAWDLFYEMGTSRLCVVFWVMSLSVGRWPKPESMAPYDAQGKEEMCG